MKEALSAIVTASTIDRDLIEKFMSEIDKKENNMTLEELKECLRKLPEEDRFSASWSWIEKEGNKNLVRKLSFENLKENLEDLAESYRHLFIDSWMEEESNNLSLESLVEEVLKLLPENRKSDLIDSWIEKNLEGIELKSLEVVLKLLPGWQKLGFTTEWVENQNNHLTLEDIREVLALLDSWEKRSLALTFTKKGYLEEVLELMSNHQDDYEALELAKKIIEESTEESKLDIFIKVAKKDYFGSLYSHEEVQKEYSRLKLPISKLPDLCHQLHPNNERLQAELFSEFIRSGRLQDKSILKDFVNSLQENEQALTIISLVEDYPSIMLTESEILDLSSQRLSRKYQSISQSLSQKLLLDSLTEGGRKTVLDLFGNSADLGSKTLADLFSYYDIKDDLVGFKSVTETKILPELASAYSPNVNSPYIAEKEYEKLQQLFNSAEHKESNLELPKVEVLANYLKSKVEIPTVDPEQFQFGRSEYFANDSASLAEITETFKNLLRAEVASLRKQDVAEFFKKALNLTDAISSDNQDKLLLLFQNRRNDLAFLLQKDEGRDQLYSIIHALGDGCVANIANHVNNALYQSLINDSCDQALYGVFHEKISTPILNSGKDYLGGYWERTNIFNNPSILPSLISPNGLIKALEERFFKDGKIITSSWDFIEEKLGKDLRDKLCEECNYDDVHSAKIAAYIILKETVPEILESKYLRTFKESFGRELKEAKKALIEEALNKRKIPPSEPSPSPSSEVRQASNLSPANTNCCVIS